VATNDIDLPMSNMESDRVALEAVRTAFPLLKINRVSEQIPAIVAVAIGVESRPS
jgi:hypothetical protein